MTAPVIVCNYEQLFRLFEAICHPESVEGWEFGKDTPSVLRGRLAAIEQDLRDPFMDRETAFTLLDEMAEIQIKMEKG